MTPCLSRHARKREPQRVRFVAYDLETTRIRAGTPRPLYLTAYAENPDFYVSQRIESIDHLGDLLVARFLTVENIGTRFVAWNGNHFDAYIVAAALLRFDDYVMRPFLTRGKTLRGLMVMRRGELNDKKPAGWYFVDGIAMTGLVGTSLEKFLKTFAPDFQKLKDSIDFEKEEFDPTNPDHVEYAERDSIGLWHGITRADEILRTYFNESLAVTMGAACIKVLTANIPELVCIWQPAEEHLSIVRDYVMRGGFCWLQQRYRGPVWKYDINQAYAAAMREAKLPAGTCYQTAGLNKYALVFVVRITATHAKNIVPFYYKTMIDGRIRAVFSTQSITDTWVTSIEYEQLKSEGWRIEVKESLFWSEYFSLTDYVNKLEKFRTTCDGGPNGAIGTMVKAVGNHSYGKTVEQLSPLDMVIARECPDGYAEHVSADEAMFSHVWYREKEITPRKYHQPQIGAFITAHVRMVVRRAALVDPKAWIYADTDCVVFSRDVSRHLDIDPRRYGAWKKESEGEPYSFVAKKVYASQKTRVDDRGRIVPEVAHAKGLNVRRLTATDFEAWYDGEVPEQTQDQRNNFVKVMRGEDMFNNRKRKGTAI